MIITLTNVTCCLIGMMIGVYTMIRHLNIFNHGKTPSIDTWLVAVGTLAWSLALYANLQDVAIAGSVDSDKIGLSVAQTLANTFMLFFWLGIVLQVQKHCLKLKLRKRKLERIK